MTRNNGGAATVEELQFKVEELQGKLAQREHDTAEIAEALEAAQKNGGGERWEPKTYLLIFWALVGARILMTNYCMWLAAGFVGLIAEVLFIGPAAGLLWRWACGEVLRDLGNGLIKCLLMLTGLFVAAMIFSAGFLLDGHVEIADGEMSAAHRPLWSFLWLSFVMAVLLSPFCDWLKQNLVKLARHPGETSREWFGKEDAYDGREEDSYDGRGED
jgi:hypothetical protein